MKKDEFYGIAPFGATPTYRQLEHFKIGKKAFFHFGVNSFTENEWGDGCEKEKIFNPTDIDVREWIRDIKAAGFKLAIITAKHHDGFCLWPSKYTSHSVKSSPYKDGNGDIIKEFTDACHEYNVKVGIYLSPWDRNCKYWDTPEYNTFYANQLEELLTGYGKIDEIWWDGAGSLEAKYDWGRWAYLIRKHQPDAIIFGSMGAANYAEARWVGNEAGFAGSTHYASINLDSISAEIVEQMNVGAIGGEKYIPAEVDVSIRPGWFYHKEQDSQVKSPRQLDRIWFRSVGNNAIMLLNFPPDTRGRLVRQDVLNAIDSNRRINKMLSLNFLDNASVSADSSWCPLTEIDKAIFDDDDLFYATSGEKNKAEINIRLAGDDEINTVALGEKIELGERITAFTLECLDEAEPIVLVSGTSVGYLRVLRFKSGKYKKLRLTVEGITAPITLRKLALYNYEEDMSDPASTFTKNNLATAPTAKISYNENRTEATILFGGIYPFDSVSFLCHLPSNYEVFAFDGSKYYSIAKGSSPDYLINLKLDKEIETSYQIKIYVERGLAIDPDFRIF